MLKEKQKTKQDSIRGAGYDFYLTSSDTQVTPFSQTFAKQNIFLNGFKENVLYVCTAPTQSVLALPIQKVPCGGFDRYW